MAPFHSNKLPPMKKKKNWFPLLTVRLLPHLLSSRWNQGINLTRTHARTHAQGNHAHLPHKAQRHLLLLAIVREFSFVFPGLEKRESLSKRCRCKGWARRLFRRRSSPFPHILSGNLNWERKQSRRETKTSFAFSFSFSAGARKRLMREEPFTKAP